MTKIGNQSDNGNVLTCWAGLAVVVTTWLTLNLLLLWPGLLLLLLLSLLARVSTVFGTAVTGLLVTKLVLGVEKKIPDPLTCNQSEASVTAVHQSQLTSPCTPCRLWWS